jgi:WhiB family redox-sensing transcriptional regulator
MIDTPDWGSAVCASTDPEIFYPEQGGKQVIMRAKRVCNGPDDGAPCPIRDACLEYALANDEPEGVWGGLGRAERVAVALQRGLPVRAPEDEMVEP